VRNFMVARWERGRSRRRDLVEVRAETAELAIRRIAASRGTQAVYEAWPSKEPGNNLRMTFARHGE
jgi:hypothetical protein